MVSSEQPAPRRKPPEERRRDIVDGAAEIALTDGLERITLRNVAEHLGVRAGLINHYFPAVTELVAEAFSAAVTRERLRLLHSTGSPVQRVAHLAHSAQDDDAASLARLWLNARHLARFNDALAQALEDQETLDRTELVHIVEAGIQDGTFAITDALAASVRILVAIDGFGAYANNRIPFTEPSFTRWVPDVAEWALGLPPGALSSEAPGRR